MFEDLLDNNFEEEYAPPEGLADPRASDQWFGHEGLEENILKQINSGSLPHALILSGPKGTGKCTFAFRIARTLFKAGIIDPCQDSLFGDAPAEINSMDISRDDPIFSRVQSGGHPDLLYVGRTLDEKKGKMQDIVNVDSIRKVTPFLRMTSSSGGWRVVILDDADTMNRNAQNAILKILEEPPANTLLILVCHRIWAMIPTIRSRCRTLTMGRLAEGDMEALLQKAAPSLLDKERAVLISMAEGSIGRAIQLVEEGGLETLDDILAILNDWESWDWPYIHRLSNALSRKDESYKAFARILEWIVSSIVFAKAKGETSLVAPLNSSALQNMMGHYSLEEWVEICDKLKAHFMTFQAANLDKRQAVLGAFTILH